ncbi:hypothetical protein FQA39_LY09884 [Lamprigera yunnana]|nr:hypothetical protein FQA39_LY09884 [Lamprigera yunnana]
MKLLVVLFVFAFAKANAYSYRIVGGEEAVPHSFPHQVALFVEVTQGTALCGGSIINERVILTAAHCVDKPISIKVIVGAHNIRENEASQQVFENANAIVHKLWFPIFLKNDIALVKLDQSIQLNEFAKIINLPTPGADITGQLATVSGWGLSQDGGSASSTLNFVQSTVMANEECNKWYFGNIGDRQMCLNGKDGKSSCRGDSGGPLIVRAESGDTQHGIVSFGIVFGCEIGFPSAYTKVEKRVTSITHRGHSLYAARQKQLSKLYKQYKQSGESYGQFCQCIKDDINIDTAVVENTINAPIAGRSFANRHNSGKSGNTEDRAVPDNVYNFDSIFNMDDSEMDIQNDMENTLSTQGNRAGIDSSRGSDCNANVTILGVRSAFDTGSSLSGVTNSEHVAITCTGIGLNNKIPSNIVSYTPMKPTGSNKFTADDLITRLYEDDAPAAKVAKSVNALNTTWSTGITRGYNQQLEQYYLLKTGSKSNIIQEQPKAYIGLFAIPNLNPALQSRFSKFLYLL